MNKIVVIVCAFAVAAAAFGERSLTPGVEAFNASVPNDFRKTVVFSPLSFEYDCCVFAEALDPIGRANVSEKLSVMTDFTGAYYPIIDAFEAMPPTNRLVFESARTIGVWDIPKVNSDFKKRVFDLRMNSSISLLWPAKGAEAWFRAKLDGWMEDFVIPLAKVGHQEYSFVDAAVIIAELCDDAACTRLDKGFRVSRDSTKSMPFIKFRAKVDFVRSSDRTMLRVPLRGGAYLFLLVPGEKNTLANVRGTITGENIKMRTLEPLDPNIKGNGSAVCEITMPALDVMTTTDMEKGFEVLRIQEKDVSYLYPELTSRSSFQSVRFCLRQGEVADGAAELPAATMKAVLDKPFMFFVYCPDINAIPAIGQFTGQ